MCGILISVFLLTTNNICLSKIIDSRFLFFLPPQDFKFKCDKIRRKKFIKNVNYGYNVDVISMKNLLSFYKYILLQKPSTEDLIENCEEAKVLFEKQVSRKIVKKNHEGKYEYKIDNDNKVTVSELVKCIEHEGCDFLEYYHNKHVILKQWMNALVSSINLETEINNIRKLENKILNQFFDEIEQLIGFQDELNEKEDSLSKNVHNNKKRERKKRSRRKKKKNKL